MKIIYVDKCLSCPYRHYAGANICRANNGRIIMAIDDIPDWCPLSNLYNPWGIDDTEMQEGEWVGDEGAR
jgi:hypothetical protein